jgi:hypothetical protein
MTSVKEQAVAMIKTMPDDKVVYVIDILNGITGLSAGTTMNDDSIKALKDLQKYRGRMPSDINYKKELAEARTERYES